MLNGFTKHHVIANEKTKSIDYLAQRCVAYDSKNKHRRHSNKREPGEKEIIETKKRLLLMFFNMFHL